MDLKISDKLDDTLVKLISKLRLIGLKNGEKTKATRFIIMK